MYQRIGASAFKKDLTNIVKLCDALGNPQDNFKSIHVAGTNGKGSTSHILSAIYQAQGYEVGLYTSPHLLDFRERIKLNGELCPKEFVISFTKSIEDLIEEIQPSFFEITVAMAFSYFAEKQVDIAIIETGLGGRLDSTNIINPLACIITSISFDHKDMLGDSLELIAAEKAGIIKTGIPVVTGNITETSLNVIHTIANSKSAPHYTYKDKSFDTDLIGQHQQWNIGCALSCIDLLQTLLPTDEATVRRALTQVSKISNFEGRWQILNEIPLVICDVAHNEQGISLISEELQKLNMNLHLTLGFVKDKDLSTIIPLLPVSQQVNIVKPSVVRGMEAEDAVEEFSKAGITSFAFNSLQEALNDSYESIIRMNQENNTVLFIGGSNFVIADLLHLKAEGNLPWIS